MRDQKQRADLLRGALIVWAAIGVVQASGTEIPALRGKKGRPVHPLPPVVKHAMTDCPAYQEDTVQKMRDQEIYAVKVRATLIVEPTIIVLKASPKARHALLEEKGRPVQNSVNRATTDCPAYQRTALYQDAVQKMRDQESHAVCLRTTVVYCKPLIVGPAIGVHLVLREATAGHALREATGRPVETGPSVHRAAADFPA